MTHTQTIVVLMALSVSACGDRPAVEAPAPVAASADTEKFVINKDIPPKFFRSGAGLEVEIVYLEDTPDGASRALCRLRGAPHPLIGKSLLLRGKVVQNTYEWSIQFDGKLRRLLWADRQLALNSHVPQFRLTLPRDVGILQLEYDAERSLEINPQELITIHKDLVADGTIAKMEEIDRDHYKAYSSEIQAAATKDFQKACGRAVPVEVDWDSAFGAMRQSRKTCDFVFERAAKACTRDYSSMQIFNERVAKITCSFGDKSQVALTDGTLAVEIAASDRNYVALYDDIKKALALTDSVGEDDAGKIVVINPDTSQVTAYLGDGKVMRKLLQAQGKPGQIWSPTAGSVPYRVNKEGVFFLCNDKTSVRFKPVSHARRLDILQNAKYESPLWQREAFGLARDDRGTYYYVDHKRPEFGGKDFRVFIGPRGAAKPVQLVDVVDDSNGKIFATKSGNLRLILEYGESRDRRVLRGSWVAKKKKVKIVILPIYRNKDLIYSELGAYDSTYFGTPCE